VEFAPNNKVKNYANRLSLRKIPDSHF